MNAFNNIIRGPVTSLIGLFIIIASVYSCEFSKAIEWIWSGLIGVGVGGAMLFIPDKLGPLLEKVLNRKSGEV